MASLALQVVRRMAAGTCPFMGLYLDMEQGTVTPTYATPGGGGAGGAVRRRANVLALSLHEPIQRTNMRGATMPDETRNGNNPLGCPER